MLLRHKLAKGGHLCQAPWLAGVGDRYELREPLIALARAIWQALDLPEPAGGALHETAVVSRKAGRLTQAMAAAHELSSLPSILSHTKQGGEAVAAVIVVYLPTSCLS